MPLKYKPGSRLFGPIRTDCCINFAVHMATRMRFHREKIQLQFGDLIIFKKLAKLSKR